LLGVAGGLAATKAGAVVVNTMPMPRAEELTKIVDKAEIKLALCDTRILDELVACAKRSSFAQEAPARHAGELGYQVIVVADACRAADMVDLRGRLWPAEDVRALSLAHLRGETATIVDVARALRAVGTAKACQRRGREGPDCSIGIQPLAEVFSSARDAIFLRT
jgi:acyl-coenzyme A synthetase/AMP-(fatty) acid ligase